MLLYFRKLFEKIFSISVINTMRTEYTLRSIQDYSTIP